MSAEPLTAKLPEPVNRRSQLPNLGEAAPTGGADMSTVVEGFERGPIGFCRQEGLYN